MSKYYTVRKEDGHMVSGKWFDSVCYRITVHYKGQFDMVHKSKTLRTWPLTEDNAWQEVYEMMLDDNERTRRKAEKEDARLTA